MHMPSEIRKSSAEAALLILVPELILRETDIFTNYIYDYPQGSAPLTILQFADDS